MVRFIRSALFVALAIATMTVSMRAGGGPLVLTQGGTVTVPNVIGMTQQEVQKVMDGLGLELKVDTFNSDPRQVAVKQEPAAGATLKKGETVYVSFRPKK